MNAYWENNYYYNSVNHAYLNCQSPSSQELKLNDFLSGIDYNVTYFPTRMNTSITPASQVVNSGSDTITLDLSTEPLNGIFDYHLDTLHSDYGFIISMNPIVRNAEIASPLLFDEAWDFEIFPNPARNSVSLSWIYDELPKTIDFIDLLGHVVASSTIVNQETVSFNLEEFAKGVYSVRVSDENRSISKLLIVQ